MTRIRVRGFKIFVDRHGKQRCYHRSTGTPIDLTQAPLGSAAFMAECARIADKVHATGPKPGTLGLLVEKYRSSRAFTELSPLTRRDYQRVFDYLQPIGDTPLSRFNAPLVVRILDRAVERRGRRQGNYVKAVLSLLFAWGMERGLMKENPARGVRDVRRARGSKRANRPWSDEERYAVLAAMPDHMKPALALMMYTGLGPKDALKLPRSAYADGEVFTRRSKTDEPVYWPAPAALREVLDAAPAHSAITLCANSAGRPWTESGFRASWRPIRQRLEQEGKVQPGLTLYGLRHTMAVILREAGEDERTIADALGQRTPEMARHYARGADLKPKMRRVSLIYDEEENKRRTKAVKPEG